MNPFQRLGQRIVNWWKGPEDVSETKQASGINSPSFLEALGIKKHNNPLAEVTYFTCLKMMSETLGKMPIKMYQSTEKGTKAADETESSKLLTERPNPLMTPAIFWSAVENNRNHYGNGYVYIQREFKREKFGGELKTKALWIMQSECVRVLVDDAGIFAGKGEIWYEYTDPITSKMYVINGDDVMHFKTSHSFDGLTGKPVKDILSETVEGAKESQNFMNKLYKSGLTAKATLEYTGEMSEEAKNALVRSFEEFGSGSENTGKILPVPLGMKLTPLDIKLTDSQFFELKKYTALQIAAAFGIKPNQINDYSKSSYANSELQQLSFYVDTALFVIKMYEEEINYKFPTEAEKSTGVYYKFNEKVLFRTDSKTQMEYLTLAVQNTIYMPNEARRKLDLEDAEGGDVLIANGNIIPLTMAGAAYTKSDPAASNDE